MKKNIIRLITFLLLLSFVLLKYDNIFSFKYDDGIYSLSTFYELEDNSVDVLCLGSSKMFQGINPAILWDKYGIAAFDLGGSIQPLWNTYYYLKEALKTQSPELVILDAYRVMEAAEYMDDSRIIKSVAGMKWSIDKLNALMVSAPKDRWLEFGFEYIRYHRRYNGDITMEDFAEDKGDSAYYSSWQGFVNIFDTTVQKFQEIENDGARINLSVKSEYWYRKIIELCRNENLPLLIVVAPCAGYDEEQQKYYNEAAVIAEEYGISFVNFNNYFEEMELDLSTDFPEHAHLNYLGNAKYTNYLADYIKKNYEISDRRKDNSEKYTSWNKAKKNYVNSLLDYQIANVRATKEYLEMLSELPEDYKIIVSVSGILSDNGTNKDLLRFLDACQIGYNQDYLGIYWTGSFANMELISVQERPYEEKYGVNYLVLQSDGIYFKGNNYKENVPGVNIVVFDISNMNVADSVYIDDKGMMYRGSMGG